MKNLFLILAFCFKVLLNAQTMVVHYTSATHFYYRDGTVTYNVFGSELWYNYPSAGETTISDLTLTIATSIVRGIRVGEDEPFDIPDYDEGGSVPKDYTSCGVAKTEWGAGNVRCGPLYTLTTGYYCANNSTTPACEITGKNCIYWSPDGQYNF